jgi:hypothetical protein
MDIVVGHFVIPTPGWTHDIMIDSFALAHVLNSSHVPLILMSLRSRDGHVSYTSWSITFCYRYKCIPFSSTLVYASMYSIIQHYHREIRNTWLGSKHRHCPTDTPYTSLPSTNIERQAILHTYRYQYWYSPGPHAFSAYDPATYISCGTSCPPLPRFDCKT